MSNATHFAINWIEQGLVPDSVIRPGICRLLKERLAGHHYLDAYFRKCSERLKPEGMMLLQAITIADQRYEAARKSVDFIQRHIFPGSCIPSVAFMSDALARVTDMRLVKMPALNVE